MTDHSAQTQPGATDMAQRGSSTGSEHSAGLLDVAAIWRRRWYLGASLVATLGLAMAYLMQTTPLYEAEARVMIEKRTTPADQAAGPDRNFLDTQVEVIRSPVTLRRALAKVDYSVPGDREGDPLTYLMRTLRVSPVVGTDVLKIGVRGESPRQTVELADAIIAGYREYLGQEEHARNVASLERLKLREQDAVAQLATVQDEYREFRKTSPFLGNGKDAVLVQLAALRNLGDMTNTVKNRRMDLESKLRVFASATPVGDLPVSAELPATATAFKRPEHLVDGRGGSRTAEATDDDLVKQFDPGFLETVEFDPATVVSQGDAKVAAQELSQLQLELRQAEARLQELTGRGFGTRHPEVAAAHRQIDRLEGRLHNMQNASAVALAQEVKALKLTEQNLAALYETELDAAKSQETYATQEQQFLDRMRRLEELHHAIVAQRIETQVADEALANGNGSVVVEVLEEPELSESQVWPKPLPFLAVCSIVTLVGGSLVISLWPRLVEQNVRE